MREFTPSSPPRPDQKLFGLLTRRPRWGLSWHGWLILGLLASLAAITWLLGVHPFFAITARVDTPFLVVEGWVQDNAIHVAVDEFRRGSYERVFSTGGTVQGAVNPFDDTSSAARLGAERLMSAGIPAAQVQMVPSGRRDRDRTYGGAVAFRTWCQENRLSLVAFNVLTSDVHARRTRLLYQEAFGAKVKVGIIAVPNPDYDAQHWWRYSQGVRAVVSECIAYIYATCFFSPESEVNR